LSRAGRKIVSVSIPTDHFNLDNRDFSGLIFCTRIEEMEQKRLRLEQVLALFATADEEDYEDSDDMGVLPKHEVKTAQGQTEGSEGPTAIGEKEKLIALYPPDTCSLKTSARQWRDSRRSKSTRFCEISGNATLTSASPE
jgi:hypothetical protein